MADDTSYEAALKSVRRIVAEEGESEVDQVGPDTKLLGELGLDSGQIIHITDGLAKEFNIEALKVEEVYANPTPAELTRLVLKLQAEHETAMEQVKKDVAAKRAAKAAAKGSAV
ncbi:acyl carrier protein [Streptomyces sp. BE303]|uniref:acyl carrier protein n=1 Tax=Streptomyces sp. BE303 TaxID=3002528 RepID=UPI002E79B115|nr:acyl carrier protein [Streptomyces sp. BE303]MED7947396.1 acyl carrier protein [Streptomyces sp. BE303]